MPIDPRMVKWDDGPPAIDARMVKWDDAGAVEKKPSSTLPPNMEFIRDLAAGGLRGATSIGSTILAPFKAAFEGTGQSGAKNERAKILGEVDSGLKYLGADPESIGYQGGKIGAEIAGTLGAGGVLAKGMQAVPVLAKFAPVVESGGFNLGNAATKSGLANTALRAGGGAVQGGVSAAMVDPQSAGMGVAIGGAAPGVIRGAGMAGDLVSRGLDSASRKLMTSALKPTIEMHRKGEAAKAVQTLLDEGINATQGGVNKLKGRISGINDDIASIIANSNATVSKQKVLDALDETKGKFSMQVSPTSDLSAIESVGKDFAEHPMLAGIPNPAVAGKSIFVDQSGNIVNDVAVPTAPKLRSLLGELKRSGGLNPSELSDLGVEGLNKNYPGLLNKNGRTMDSVVEWMQQHGWLSDADIAQAEKFGVGGSHELARDMIRSAVDRQPIIHPADGDAFYNYSKALQDLADRGIIKVKVPGAEGSISGGIEGDGIPIQLAQKLKQGTYKVLKGKYGEVGSASTEAQKALARGLKEEIAAVEPSVKGLNARESDLLNALKVTERRALMDANKNPVGLGPLAPNKAMLLAFLADRSAALKSLAARGAYQTSQGVLPSSVPGLVNQYGLLGAPSVLGPSLLSTSP